MIELVSEFLHRAIEFRLSEHEILEFLTWFMVASSFITFTGMYFLKLRASYGRYCQESSLAKSFQFSIPARTAWALQELPSVVIPCIALFLSYQTIPFTNLSVILLFLVHYIQRTFVYSLRIRGGKPTPVHLFLLGAIFTTWNGYIQGFHHARYAFYSSHHLYSFRGIFGILIFFYGMFVNIHSDYILRNLRKPNEVGYKIPRGGLFEYVSGANFYGEIVEWFGYALYANTWTAWAFSFFTMANTIPRAIEHHEWYLKKFDHYPKDRKAVIPFIL